MSAQLSYCRPTFATGTVTCGKAGTLLGSGYSGPGYGNTSSERSVEVGISLWVSPTADVSAAVAATERIEVSASRTRTPRRAVLVFP
ncbi:MAG: hypothetical protein IPM35_39495 [Myxococcales bacterium]|nr:hypothetical protein [Myxococcales bacterium]